MREKKAKRRQTLPNFARNFIVWAIKKNDPEAEVYPYSIERVLGNVLVDLCFKLIGWFKSVAITAALLILGTIPVWGFRPEIGWAALLIHLALEVWGEVVKKVRGNGNV